MTAEAPPRPARSRGAGRFASLDGLRALSIFLVLEGHSESQLAALAPRFRPFLINYGQSATGVSVFFVLSGYLITRLLLEEEGRHGAISLGRFYLRRAFRILPAFYLYVAFIALLVACGAVQLAPTAFLSAVTFTWNYWGAGGWWLGHSWSLSVEEQFYIFWPLALVLAGRKHAPRLVVAIIVLEPLIRVGSYFAFPGRRAYIPVMGHTRMDVLLFGCLLALIEHAPAGRAWLARQVTTPKAAIALVLLVVGRVLAHTLGGGFDLPIGMSLEAASIAVLLYWSMTHATGRVGQFLNWAPVAWLGRISYSLYLWQQFFLTPDGWVPRVFPLPLCYVGAIAAAAGSYYLVEQPMLRVRDRVLARGKRAPASPVAVAST